jgi:myo-inositol-1(or 4)-monophosphatase
MDKHLQVAVKAAQEAGQYQRAQFGTVSEHAYKSPGDPISEIDHKSEQIVLNRLSTAFPDHAILSEEAGLVGSDTSQWIVDPLDGTSNYVREIPDFTVSIAFEEDGQVQLGVVYRPMSSELFVASTDSGSNQYQTLGVSDTDTIDSALVAIPYSSSQKQRDKIWSTHRSFGTAVEGIRSTGSGALDLAYLAAGRTDAVYGFDQSKWDRAAGCFLIRAAGGRITDHAGQQSHSGNFVASNGVLHGEILDQVA